MFVFKSTIPTGVLFRKGSDLKLSRLKFRPSQAQTTAVLKVYSLLEECIKKI
ncbi:unnamed protein product [Eruca vesicaria subsp. sativa]|uniref:Uncharacterized protein n=1 Tax=Eruca vesicaria subsp. sativa TaxID=29727 RepID=A0ABC8KMA0_ERUVS|nr:unnamed protein product [Eruca vesicaria subsp. sativa]